LREIFARSTTGAMVSKGSVKRLKSIVNMSHNMIGLLRSVPPLAIDCNAETCCMPRKMGFLNRLICSALSTGAKQADKNGDQLRGDLAKSGGKRRQNSKNCILLSEGREGAREDVCRRHTV
jgi:hypothetical protein